jgi:hypothetical protein
MLRDVAGQPTRYGAIFRERFTDDRGIYRIYGLPPGTYLVMAGGGGNYGYGANAYDYDSPTYSPSSSRDTAAEVNVNAGEETANVDIRYRAEPGYVVSGIASGPSAPENSGFNVNLTATLDGGSQWNDSSYQPQGGRGFAFYGVADGDYDITAQTYLSGEWALSESRRIKVRGADISQIELITKPMGAISGRVALEDSKAAECKNKRRPLFSETLITVWHNEKIKAKDQPQFIWSLGAPASPDKQGNISLRSLAPGQYHFITRFSAKYWYLKSISLKAPSSGAKPLTPAADIDAARNWTTIKTGERLSGLTVTLAEGAASLQGKLVFQDSDKPPPRLFVYLVPAEPEKANDVLRFFATPVEQDGKITVNNLAPGRYWIVVRPPLVVGSSTLTKLRLPDETETRAKLRQDAEASNTTIEFKPCQNVLDYKLGFKPSTTAAAKQ